MAGREVREYTNLSDPKDKKWGKGKDKIDDEDITFQRMVAKLLHEDGFLITCPGRDLGLYRVADASRCKRLLENVEVIFMDEEVGIVVDKLSLRCTQRTLDSDDLLYLKEQMEAEEDAERLLRRTEKRAFAAFKRAASVADSSPASVPLPLRVEPKPKSGIRQQDLLKKVVEIKPKRQKVSSPPNANRAATISNDHVTSESNVDHVKEEPTPTKAEDKTQSVHPVKSLLGIAYESDDEE